MINKILNILGFEMFYLRLGDKVLIDYEEINYKKKKGNDIMGRPHKREANSKCPFCGETLNIVDGRYTCPNECEKK